MITSVQHHTMNRLQRHTIEQTVRDLQELHAWTTEARPWHSDITAENREQTRAYKMGYIRGIADMLTERLDHMLRMEQSERELLEELEA